MILNFTPETYGEFKQGVPETGTYSEIFNSDHPDYFGSGILNNQTLSTTLEPKHNQPQSLTMKIPPLACIILKKK